MTFLQLVQQVFKEVGLASPSTAIGNTAQNVIQIMALLDAVGQELTEEFTWNQQYKEHSFTTVSTATTGTWTTSADTVTSIPDTTGLDTTYMAVGTGIPNDTFIESVDSGTQVTLTRTPTAAGTAATITFYQMKYTLPTDYDRQEDRTHFDKGNRWELLGPESPQEWQWLKSSYISTGPRVRYRIMANKFQIWPAVANGQTLQFEYLSKSWVTASGGSSPSKTGFTVDTDTCIFRDRLMILGAKLKYFEIKGFDTTAFYRDFTKHLDIAKAADKGARTLSFAPSPATVLIGFENIPDTNYG